jgi:hypothetical protein
MCSTGPIRSWAWAEEGTRTTGKGRGNHSQAPRGRDQRCYEHRPTAFRSKITAPEPRIVRAPELVLNGISTVVRGCRLFFVPTVSFSSIENSWKNKMILRGADCPQSFHSSLRIQKARAKDVEEPVEKLTRSWEAQCTRENTTVSKTLRSKSKKWKLLGRTLKAQPLIAFQHSHSHLQSLIVHLCVS